MAGQLPIKDWNNPMNLERAEVEHIAALARIGLAEADVEMFQEQLSHILEQVDLLRQLDTTGVPPTGHAIELEAVMRDDVPAESLDPEEVLSDAPRREGNLFRVKAVLEE
jgi:aspartyl-tRNA(Asn)/glutamyl-tRNA(Gln) amidotransferase subunit C